MHFTVVLLDIEDLRCAQFYVHFIMLLLTSLESQNVAAFQLKNPCPARQQTSCSGVEDRNILIGCDNPLLLRIVRFDPT